MAWGSGTASGAGGSAAPRENPGCSSDARASSLGFDRVYLLTNKKCAPAIHLYEKLGLVHDAEIMRQFGARYERCDVAMSYRPGGQGSPQRQRAAGISPNHPR